MLTNISIDFQDDLTSEQIEMAIAEMDMHIKKKYPQIKRIFIKA